MQIAREILFLRLRGRGERGVVVVRSTIGRNGKGREEGRRREGGPLRTTIRVEEEERGRAAGESAFT